MLQTALRLLCFGAFAALTACTGPIGPEQASRVAFGPYVIHANDQLHIQVYGEDSITGDYKVDSAGMISVPLAGRVRAAGSTTGQLERSLRSQFSNGKLTDARVNVQISAYGPVYVRGEVKHPGEFPFRPGLRVSDAVALAGGYTYRADETKVLIRAAGAGQPFVRPLDVDAPVWPGDNIQIPERLF